jgi:hypothetical protein
MPKGNSLTTTERLSKAINALEVIQSTPEIQDCFTPVGFGADKISAAISDHGNVTSLIYKQLSDYGEQHEATADYNNAFSLANKPYLRTLKISKIYLGDNPHAVTALQMSGDRDQSFSGWYKQTDGFYSNILDNQKFLNKVAEAGVTVEKLTAEYELVKAVKEASKKQDNESGQAQQATKIRDKAIDKFFKWINKFYKMAHIALEENPQWKERIGILERS